jgi:hypothetical protein
MQDGAERQPSSRKASVRVRDSGDSVYSRTNSGDAGSASASHSLRRRSAVQIMGYDVAAVDWPCFAPESEAEQEATTRRTGRRAGGGPFSWSVGHQPQELFPLQSSCFVCGSKQVQNTN